MKKILLPAIIISALASCSKKEEILTEGSVAENNVLPYDTTAIDSFAPGATPNNVIMNRVVVDSAYLTKIEEEKLLAKKKKEEADKEKAKQEDEAKKKEEAKKKKEEKPKAEAASTVSDTSQQ